MSHVAKILYIAFLMLFVGNVLFAQSPLDTLAMRVIMVNQLFPQERVYLHFDNTGYYLGDIFNEGNIVQKNDSIAYEYYMKAAVNGYAASQRMIGKFFEDGIFVNANYNESLKWYSLATEQNDVVAMYKMGMHFAREDSVNNLSKRKLRKSQAIIYMRKSARAGNKDAQNFIVKCFAESKYLKKSRKKAFEWMKSIAELG